jgi:two-component SAPR family response regulator
MTILRPFQHWLLMGRIIFWFLLVLGTIEASAQSHGLEFSSHEVIPEKRTSLDLTPDKKLCFSNTSEILFDFKFRPGRTIYFGYIMRLITDNNRNIDLIYNQRLRNFNFVIGESFSSVFEIDSAHLFGSWNQLQITVDKKAKQVSLSVNKKFIAKAEISFPEKTCYHAFFGTNDFEGFETVDIPPMQIKDIRINEDGKEKYFFPLSENHGNQSFATVGAATATAKNPVWIKPRHQNWQKVLSLQTNGIASVAFDKKKEVLCIVSKDSLYSLSVKDLALAGVKYARAKDSLPWGNQSVFDAGTDKLYNVYIDDKQVSEYNPATQSWDKEFAPKELTIYWQANKFLSPVDSSLYVMAGYGQLRYRNTVQRYNLSTHTWEMLEPKGDLFMPRYMAGLGVNASGDTAFIIGGYGSNTGDQTINPKYNYDLLAYSIKNNTFKQVYHLTEPEKNFCFANSLVIGPDGNEFYALTYPKDRFNSSLQLIKGSLREPSYELMGDSLPYLFYDVESFADLYYCPTSSKLVAVTLHTSQQNVSNIHVYTIDFPPNQLMPVVSTAKQSSGRSLWWLIGGGIVIIALAARFWLKKNKRRTGALPARQPVLPMQEKTVEPIVETPAYELPGAIVKEQERASIHLFGRFEATDKNGVDVTTQFTPLLKELFLLVLLYSVRDSKGISSEKLYEILWSDKPTKDAKNNYSVNIVKLKTILEKIGETHIGRESGKLRLDILNQSVKIDYEEFVRLVSDKQVVDKKYIQQLLNITSRGSFLNEVHYSWLDNFKSEISGLVIDILLGYAARADMASEADLIIKISNTIFSFDHLNDAALEYKCKSLVLQGRYGMAKDAYLKFAKEYKENYGLDFDKTFLSITGQE